MHHWRVLSPGLSPRLGQTPQGALGATHSQRTPLTVRTSAILSKQAFPGKGLFVRLLL